MARVGKCECTILANTGPFSPQVLKLNGYIPPQISHKPIYQRFVSIGKIFDTPIALPQLGSCDLPWHVYFSFPDRSVSDSVDTDHSFHFRFRQSSPDIEVPHERFAADG